MLINRNGGITSYSLGIDYWGLNKKLGEGDMVKPQDFFITGKITRYILVCDARYASYVSSLPLTYRPL